VRAEEHRVNRKEFIALGGLGALTVAGGGVLGKLLLDGSPVGAQPFAGVRRRFVATDGHIALPGRPAYPDPDLFVMGFVNAPFADSVFDPGLDLPPDELDPGQSHYYHPDNPASIGHVTQDFKGRVKVPAPIMGVDENRELMIVLTNVGFIARPDLDDSHTIHWHGFRNPVALFDGVPEVSVAVPVYRNFPYVYKPHDEGTYIYHCHFEDSEHVQMQMTGIVFVNPEKGGGFAYDDDDASTAYDRQFTLLLNEIDQRPHDGLERIQEFVWSNYSPQYWVINGRSYPDTVEPGATATSSPPAHLESQPVSSLMQVNPGERVLMRIANLGYEQQSMQLVGIPMTVVGEDATFLRGQDGTDLSYGANSLYIGPGEARDVLFTAPDYSSSLPGDTDSQGDYNRYVFANRSSHKNVNPGVAGLGGQVTEVRVYASSIPDQTEPNQTYA
jgi:hypothetical protein